MFGALTLGPAALSSSAQGDTPRTIRVISVTTWSKYVDVAPKGDGPGDYVLMRDVLKNEIRQFGRRTGASIGSDSGRMTLTSKDVVSIDVTARLPGGTLRVKGTARPDQDGDIVFPVTAGTGAYSGMTGTVTLVSLSEDGNRARNTFRLHSPLTT
jgi:hypothetical protein